MMQGEFLEALDAVLTGHPHTMVGTVEVLECLPMPET
jgi:hypothetical protein